MAGPSLTGSLLVVKIVAQGWRAGLACALHRDRAMKRKFNDPHVERLTYRVVHSDDVHYSKAPAIEIEKANFHAKLENEALSLTMKSHTSSEDEARSLVEPFLHAWEVHTGLLLAPDEIGFRYERAHCSTLPEVDYF